MIHKRKKLKSFNNNIDLSLIPSILQQAVHTISSQLVHFIDNCIWNHYYVIHDLFFLWLDFNLILFDFNVLFGFIWFYLIWLETQQNTTQPQLVAQWTHLKAECWKSFNHIDAHVTCFPIHCILDGPTGHDFLSHMDLIWFECFYFYLIWLFK